MEKRGGKVYCQRCGAFNALDAQFCYRCGAKLDRVKYGNNRKYILPSNSGDNRRDERLAVVTVIVLLIFLCVFLMSGRSISPLSMNL